MSYKAVAGRYAKALFELAVEKKAQAKVLADLQQLKNLIGESDDLQVVVHSALIDKKQKIAAFDALAKKLKFQALTQKFLDVLIENGRIKVVLSAISAYEQLLRDLNGEAVVEVRTAKPLTKKMIGSLEKSLAKVLDKKVIVESSVNEKLLGGMVVFVGSKMLDASLQGKLTHLKQLSKKEIANL